MLDYEPPPNGEYFIDRDGDKFACVLNYRRSIRLDEVDEVEAQFYSLPIPKPVFPGIIRNNIIAKQEKARKFILENSKEINKMIIDRYENPVTGEPDKEHNVEIEFPFLKKNAGEIESFRDYFDRGHWLYKVYEFYSEECTFVNGEFEYEIYATNYFAVFKEEVISYFKSLGFNCRFKSPNFILTW